MIDFDKLKALYQFGANLRFSDVQVLLRSVKRKSFAPGAYLIKEGTIKKGYFFIQKGLVRAFTVNDRGEEITTTLRWENQMVVSLDLLLFDRPSRSYFEAYEHTETLSLDFETLDAILERNPKLEQNRKHFLQTELQKAYQRIDSFVLLSPEERYLQFVESNPDIVNRVPNKFIAPVLGITPVSLSRIRKRIALKKN